MAKIRAEIGNATISGTRYISTAGTYTGDGTTNRPIAHGLGVLPNFVFNRRWTSTLYFFLNTGRLDVWIDYAASETAVTIANTTNFYVSGTLNPNIGTSGQFVWAAFSF